MPSEDDSDLTAIRMEADKVWAFAKECEFLSWDERRTLKIVASRIHDLVTRIENRRGGGRKRLPHADHTTSFLRRLASRIVARERGKTDDDERT